MLTGRRTLPLIFWMLLGGCASLPPFLSVHPEPRNHAWYLRSKVRPFGTQVRGIPVREISNEWCKANEFSIDLFPAEVLADGDMPLEQELKENNASFSISGRFGSSNLIVVVGAYQSCANEIGTFILAVEQTVLARHKLVYLDTSTGDTNFAVLTRGENDTVRMWWCLYCDNGATYKWNDKSRRFDLEPDPVDEEPMSPDSRVVDDKVRVALRSTRLPP